MAEGIPDEAAAAVSLSVLANVSLPVTAYKNDGDAVCLAERTAPTIGIEAFVTEQVSHATGVFEEGRRGLDVADVTCRQHQRIGAADDVGERMDRCGPGWDRPIACAERPLLQM